MKDSTKLNWILAAAVSAALASTTMAQYRVGSDGRARDANNRIGSNGLNENIPGGAQANPNSIGNDIVNNQVTGGRGFQGNVPYFAGNVFHGATAGGLSDRFIAESSGTPYGNVPQNNAQIVQPFYGSSQFATPPAGFVQQSATGAFTPAPTALSQPTAGDQRLGQTLDVPSSILPPPGQLILPGPVDSNNQTNSLITASPLYGVRQWNSSDVADQAFLTNNLGGTTAQPPKIDPVTLQKMRGELLQPPQQNGQNLNNENNSQSMDNSAGTPFDSPANQPLNNDPTHRQSLGNNATAQNNPNGPNGLGGPNNLSTGASLQQRALMSPQQQSTQYAALQQRLMQYRIVQQSAQANAFQQQQQQRIQSQNTNANALNQARTGTAAAAPNGTQPLARNNPPMMGRSNPAPSVAARPTGPAEQPQGAQNPTDAVAPNSDQGAPVATNGNPKPLQIHSLAEGVQAKGLKDLLTEAEDQMKQQHYNSALEQYELAEQVAPNNPLILLGRANAELGQSYYTRADSHLRQAFSKDEALLMGQYDLKSLLSDDRLTFLVTDLKGIAKREPKESRPLFLLAYIAYNTGNERRAAAYLDLAEKRAGGKDPFFNLIRKHWELPVDQPQNSNDVLNK